MFEKMTKENFQAEVLEHDGKVLVDFYADWCGPCRTMEPVLEKFEQRFADVKIVKVDIDAERDLAMRYDILSIPYFALFENGKFTKHVIGSLPLTKFSQAIMGE